MKRYNVLIEETVRYEVLVDVEDESEAEEEAMDTFLGSDDVNEYFLQVSDRQAVDVQEVPGHE